MDQYRRNYAQAEQLARYVLLSKKNHFLDNATATAIALDGNAYIPHISTWFALKGFRHKADEGSTERSVMAATNNWLHSATASGSSLVYTIKKQDGHLLILYGSNECNEQNGFEPIRHFRIANRCGSWDACLAIPCVSFQSSFGVEHVQ